jgi:RimJ/RimL family protein N-acetyltransferase
MSEFRHETRRLVMRDWRDEDWDRFYEAMNTPAVMKHLGGVQDRATWLAAKDRIAGFARDFGHTFWLLEDKAGGELLGFCGLKRVNSPGAGPLTGTPEIGWRLRESAWGRGIAKEAAIASLDLAFGRFDYDEIVALTVARNAESLGLMARLGMTRRPDLDFVDERFGPDLDPTIVTRISSAEWPAARAAAMA